MELLTAFPALDGRMEVALHWKGRQLFKRTFMPDDGVEDFEFTAGPIRGSGSFDVDAFAGEVRWSASLEVKDPRVSGPTDDEWETIFDVDRKVLMTLDPAIGSVGGSPVVYEPIIDESKFGPSQLCTPAILRIHVDEDERAVADVGRLVKAKMFPRHPPFVFNTVACVGGVPVGEPGLYSDPNSIWFNVFFGLYQLDAPKSKWARPFAYKDANGVDSVPEPEDVLRIGKSDWNWFSNWMYGVPIDDVEPFSDVEMSRVTLESYEPRRIGSTIWHGMRMNGIQVASCYESKARGAGQLASNTIIDSVWRSAFGLPNPCENHPESFIPSLIDAQVDMAYWEDDEFFHTAIFGGTAPTEADPLFLEAQMDATRRVIEDAYPELGFST